MRCRIANISESTFESVRQLLKAHAADPAFEPLLALFQEKHMWGVDVCPNKKCSYCEDYHEAHPEWCRGRCYWPACVGGFVTRFPYWHDAPRGALRGSLETVLQDTGCAYQWLRSRDDTQADQAALELLEAWLKERARV